MAIPAKVRHRIKLIEYLGNPENDFVNRLTQATKVIGFKDVSTLYRHFTVEELDEIEAEALEIRRKKYKPEIAKADRELFKKAHDGDVAAIKLCYQRFEDWNEKREHKIDGALTINITKFSDGN